MTASSRRRRLAGMHACCRTNASRGLGSSGGDQQSVPHIGHYCVHGASLTWKHHISSRPGKWRTRYAVRRAEDARNTSFHLHFHHSYCGFTVSLLAPIVAIPLPTHNTAAKTLNDRRTRIKRDNRKQRAQHRSALFSSLARIDGRQQT